jgi:hypothetical protein
MFQLGQLAGRGLVIEHRHSDGTWGRMEPEPEHHDPAQHDPEEGWQYGRIFKCKTCDEEVRLAPAEPGSGNEGA